MHSVTFSFAAARTQEDPRPAPDSPEALLAVATAQPGSRRRAPLATPPAPEPLAFLDTAWGLLVLLTVFAASVATTPNDVPRSAFLARAESFASPFVTPAFFLLAGVVLHRSIDAPWPAYLMRKVAPLAWRLVAVASVAALVASWLRTMQNPLRLLPGALTGLLLDPPPLFLILAQLVLCFLAARALRGVRALVALPVLAALEIGHPDFGGPFFAGSCRLMVYLYAGHIFAPEIRQIARFSARDHQYAVAGIAAWALANLIATSVRLPMAGNPLVSTLPFASLGLGLFGAAAIVSFASLIDNIANTATLRWIGARALGAFLGYYLLVEIWRALAPRVPTVLSLAIPALAAGGIWATVAMARRARGE